MFTSPQPPASITPENLLRWVEEGFRGIESAFKRLGKRQAYTPVVTSFGGSFNLGNGTLLGAYAEFGSFLVVSVDLTIGSTTTLSGSTFFFSLPRGPVKAKPTWKGSARLADQSAGTNFVGTAVTDSAFTSNFFVQTDTGIVGSTVPFTWAVGDQLGATIGYALE